MDSDDVGVRVSLIIELAGETLLLLPERGLFWERKSMLLIADWHVGKAASFRAAGIGVPDGGLDEEFARLEAMLERTAAEELLILGDFVHARDGLTQKVQEQVVGWMRSAVAQVSLICGNHDQSAGIDQVDQLGPRILGNCLLSAPFVLQHEPEESLQGYVLAGHLHPAVRLGEGKRGGLRAPCFWFGDRAGVLPAFGGFTGGHRVDMKAGERVYAVGDGEVIEVS